MELEASAKNTNRNIMPPTNGQRKQSYSRGSWQDAEYRKTFYHSLSICGSLFALGCNAGMRGATLLDLKILTDTSLERASAFLTCGAAGNLSGTLVCGTIFEKVNVHLMMFLAALLAAVTSFLTPLCSSYELMICILFTNFFISSFVNTGANASLISFWGTKSKQWMQLLHFSFAMGGVLAPLYAEPFLASETDTNQTFVNGTFLSTTSKLISNSSSHPINPRKTNVQYAFIITGAFQLLSSLPLLPFYLMNRKKVRQEKTKETRNQRQLPRSMVFLTVMLMSLFFMGYASVEGTFANFLMTFLVREYDSVSKSKGAFVTSVFWASFASGRFLNVFLSRALSLTRLLTLSISLMFVAFTGFLVAAQYGIVNALVGFTVIAGLSMSGFYAAAFSWAEAELLRVNGFISGVFIVCSSSIGVANPIILGYLMEEVDSMWFCYIPLGGTVLTCALFVILLVYSKCFLSRQFGPCNPISVNEIDFQESFFKNNSKSIR